MWLALVVSLAGGLGAVLRFVVDGVIRARVRTAFPVGTAVINLSGSFLIGLVSGAAAHLAGPAVVVLGTGLLGGYTTFSTASFETVALARQGSWGKAVLNGAGVMAGALAAAGLGLCGGSLL